MSEREGRGSGERGRGERGGGEENGVVLHSRHS